MDTHPSEHPNSPHNKVKLFSVLFYQWQAEVLTAEGRRWAFRDSFSLFLSLHPFISYQDTSIISLTRLINHFCHSMTFVKSISFTESKYSSASSWFGRLDVRASASSLCWTESDTSSSPSLPVDFYQYHAILYELALLFCLLVLHTTHWPMEMGRIKKNILQKIFKKRLIHYHVNVSILNVCI